MANSMPKVPLVQTLRELLRDVLRQRDAGVPNARFARALGYADGYMQALIDAGLAEERELITHGCRGAPASDGPVAPSFQAAPELEEFEERAVA
jgi:hypothetical protein